MKRIHLHVNVEAADFDASVAFYTELLSSEPTHVHDRYAKWLLDDPRVNFTLEVLDVAGDVPGIHHVGIQVDEASELESIRAALARAGAPVLEVGRTQCCFADSEKSWTADPQGVRWEAFRSFGQLEEYGDKTEEELALYTRNPSRER